MTDPESANTLLHKWLRHKVNRREKITIEEQVQLSIDIEGNILKFGVEAVEKVIDYSIEKHYGQIYWDRLEKEQGKFKPQQSKAKESIYSSDSSYGSVDLSKLGLVATKCPENFDILSDE